MKYFFCNVRLLAAIFFFCALLGCTRPPLRTAEPVVIEEAPLNAPAPTPTPAPTPRKNSRLQRALAAAALPDAMQNHILQSGEAVFMADLEAVFEEGDPHLWELVDKKHTLEPIKYEAEDLVELSRAGAFTIGRAGMLLRAPAAAALQEMALAARQAGVTLLASSTYRSYDYQVEVYARNVRQNGQAQADRESARPGYSQHQTGLVIDFGSITDAYAQTAAGKWLAANASAYGWSISFPDGYEEVTGYRWECWHYRYVGKPLARFIDTWFDGVQQYALQFIYEWERTA